MPRAAKTTRPTTTRAKAPDWTRAQRALLYGARVAHPLDPAPPDLAALGWDRLREISAASAAVPVVSADPAILARVSALRAEYAGPAPASPTRETEALRAAVSEQEVSVQGTHVWKSPLPEALASYWCSLGVEWALTLPGEDPRVDRHGGELRFERASPSETPAWMRCWMTMLGSRSLNMGTRYWGAVRRAVWALSGPALDEALAAGDRVWARVAESSYADREAMQCALAFVFGRDRPWATELATEWLRSPEKGSVAGHMLLSSMTDAGLAQRWAARTRRAHPADEGLLLDVVEALGARADAVLGELPQDFMKSWWNGRVEKARAFARTLP